MKAWDGWFKELGGALKDGGNPFTPAARTIAADGAVSDAKPQLSGYTIVKADSLRPPRSPRGRRSCTGGASITIYETFDVM